jgi:topoisomerase-4 subunit B
VGAAPNRRGTQISFHPDPKIFGEKLHFKPARLFAMARSKAYLSRAVEIRWSCDPKLLKDGDTTPAEAVLSLPQRPADMLKELTVERRLVLPSPSPAASRTKGGGAVEWAVTWSGNASGSRRLLAHLLQHHPDARRRHARSRDALGADQRPARLWRNGRQQEAA